MKSYNGFTPYQRSLGDKIIKDAIEAGTMPSERDCACSICGQDKGIRHYHCEDYSPDKILSNSKVVCWRCHMMIHCRYKHPLSVAKYFLNIHFLGKRYAPVFRPNDWETLEQHFTED